MPKSTNAQNVSDEKSQFSRMTIEEYENTFRRQLSGPRSRELATMRFYCANNCQVAVNAIKELKKTNDARGFFWIIAHPIEYIKEKFLIKNLISKLYNRLEGKRYNAVDVLKAFRSTSDTYTTDYGEGLNNTAGIEDITKNPELFKKDESAEKKMAEEFDEMGSKAMDVIYKNVVREEKELKGKTKPVETSKETEEIIQQDSRAVEDRADDDYLGLTAELDDLGKKGQLESARKGIEVDLESSFDNGEIVEKSQIQEPVVKNEIILK